MQADGCQLQCNREGNAKIWTIATSISKLLQQYMQQKTFTAPGAYHMCHHSSSPQSAIFIIVHQRRRHKNHQTQDTRHPAILIISYHESGTKRTTQHVSYFIASVRHKAHTNSKHHSVVPPAPQYTQHNMSPPMPPTSPVERLPLCGSPETLSHDILSPLEGSPPHPLLEATPATGWLA